MARSDKVRDWLVAEAGEEFFTADRIDAFSALDLDSDGLDQGAVDAAVAAAVADTETAWNARYREAFLKGPVEVPQDAGTVTDLPDNINDVPEPDEVTLDEILHPEGD